MEDKCLILRLSLLITLLYSNLFSLDVLVSKESIKFEEKIDESKVLVKAIESVSKGCIPLRLDDLKNDEFLSSHFINKNAIICEKDVKKFGNDSVIFNFGGVVIEKKGKVIFENNEFIRIKNLDGTIEQIYKDGRTR